MSDPTNEIKARELLKRLVQALSCKPADCHQFSIHDATECARNYLAETNPKHAAEVALENWWLPGPPREYPPSPRVSFLAGYKAGMLGGASVIGHSAKCGCDFCHMAKRIRDAAEKVPV